MVQLNISTGQGITQVLAKNIGLSREDCKKIGAQNWQQAVNDINSMNSSIFKSKNNDLSKIGDASQNHSNFVVDAGYVEIDDGIFAKVKNFLLSLVGRGDNKTETVAQPDVKAPEVKSENSGAKPAEVKTDSSGQSVNQEVKPPVPDNKGGILFNPETLSNAKFDAALLPKTDLKIIAPSGLNVNTATGLVTEKYLDENTGIETSLTKDSKTGNSTEIIYDKKNGIKVTNHNLKNDEWYDTFIEKFDKKIGQKVIIHYEYADDMQNSFKRTVYDSNGNRVAASLCEPGALEDMYAADMENNDELYNTLSKRFNS
ncbi:hypothetical protein J6E39_01530 [bacterium]|nr:hypothetical protein [bacterium]